MTDAVPIMLAYFAVSATYGILAEKEGWALSTTLLSSLVIYAGAAQFMLLSLWSAGLSPVLISLTLLIANLRHVIYATTVASDLADRAPWQRWLQGFGLTDEVFVLFASRSLDTSKISLTTAFLCYGAWIAGTLAGTVSGVFIPNALHADLSYALPALFLGLFFSGPRTRPAMVAGIVGATLAVLCAVAHHVSLGIVLGALVGAIAGFLTDHRRKQEIPDHGNRID